MLLLMSLTSIMGYPNELHSVMRGREDYQFLSGPPPGQGQPWEDDGYMTRERHLRYRQTGRVGPYLKATRYLKRHFQCFDTFDDSRESRENSGSDISCQHLFYLRLFPPKPLKRYALRRSVFAVSNTKPSQKLYTSGVISEKANAPSDKESIYLFSLVWWCAGNLAVVDQFYT